MIHFSLGSSRKRSGTLPALVRSHFKGTGLAELISAQRQFPLTARADLQNALDRILQAEFPHQQLLGFQQPYRHQSASFSSLVTEEDHPAVVAPLQYEDLDTGENRPFRCLRQGLWLCRKNGTQAAILLDLSEQYGRTSGIHLELATRPGDEGIALSNRFFDALEAELQAARTYRGKIVSLEQTDNYTGQAGNVIVHRMPPTRREDVILPEPTLDLLDRNVKDFIRHRPRLKTMGMPAKKGLLFYGPPGTGKTHTLRYLASSLQDHTTFLITAEEMGALKQYLQMARFLQPALVVIEDVDLIARDRSNMRNACEESLLNQLLNEMDGLREDAEILFVLTTNRPEHLEAALVSRPGRIDQAIEFPLPDDEGRRKLVTLYTRGANLDETLRAEVVRRTEGFSAAFIKELMRRAAQAALERAQSSTITAPDIHLAIDQMVASPFTAKILGGGVSYPHANPGLVV